MYNNINKVLENIKKSGLFEIEQLGVIEYAIYRPELSIENIKLIINPNIPSEYMSMYVRLMIHGIDVRKYVKKNWELIEIPVVDLEKTIIAENKSTIENKSVISQPKQRIIRRNNQ